MSRPKKEYSDPRVNASSDEARRESISNMMYMAPLTFPYVDFSIYNTIEDVNDRARFSMHILDPEELKAAGLDENHLPEIMVTRYQAGKYVAQRLEQLGIPMVEAGRQSNITKSALSKYASGKRAFSLEPEQLIPFCIYVLHESCHKVMFGEPGKVVLPGLFSHATAAYSRLSQEQKDAVLEKANKVIEMFNRKNPAAAYTGLHRDGGELVRERLWEYVHSIGSTPNEFLGDKQGVRLRTNIRILMEEDLDNPTTGFRNIKVFFILFLCKETGLALDYFIREDFTDYVPIYYKDFNGTVIEVTDRQMLQFIGRLTSGTKETQKEIGAAALAEYLKNNIASAAQG